jgi:hypothetical protein
MLMLHISDIHFRQGEVGEPDDPNRGLRDDVIQDVKHMRDRLGPPGMILLSGDIAYAGRKDEYEFAYSWLEKELCPAAQCPIENVFVIPGNHDVDLKAEDGPGFKAARRDLRATAAGQIDNELRKWLRDPSSSGILFSPLENYNRHFAAKLLCAIGPYNVKGPDGKIIPNVSKPFVTRDIELNDGSILRLSGFNSVLVSDLSDAENSMLVDPAAAQITRDDGVAHLVMCHHPCHVPSSVRLDQEPRPVRRSDEWRRPTSTFRARTHRTGRGEQVFRPHPRRCSAARTRWTKLEARL